MLITNVPPSRGLKMKDHKKNKTITKTKQNELLLESHRAFHFTTLAYVELFKLQLLLKRNFELSKLQLLFT